MIRSSTAIGIIPARYGSTRLPAKPLVDILGKSMIQRVWEAAINSEELDQVVVATDDARIAHHCEEFGATTVMTDPRLPSGTDRVHAALELLRKREGRVMDIVVNIQGDEPLLEPQLIDDLVRALRNTSWASAATTFARTTDRAEIFSSNVVKIAMNDARRALYFSRSPIPHCRDYAEDEWGAHQVFAKHYGIYAYRIETLNRFVSLAPSPLELTEKLEQLRLLEDGASFLCVETLAQLIAVDTQEDVDRVCERLRREGNP